MYQVKQLDAVTSEFIEFWREEERVDEEDVGESLRFVIGKWWRQPQPATVTFNSENSIYIFKFRKFFENNQLGLSFKHTP